MNNLKRKKHKKKTPTIFQRIIYKLLNCGVLCDIGIAGCMTLRY